MAARSSYGETRSRARSRSFSTTCKDTVTTMNKPKLRWGILGTANIAKKNWKGIFHSGNGIVSAVASRDAARARQFVAECQAEVPFPSAPQTFADYEQLLASREVDAVYVPLPTALRKLWVLRAAEAGKHVVCEKPCAVSTADLAEMIAACRRHHVQFVDGVMFMHSRRLDKIREVLTDGQTIGQIRRITSAFTFNQEEPFFATNIRARSELEPHGCLGDVGWYCIRFTLWIMGWALPRQVTGRMLSEFKHPQSRKAVPTEFTGELFFEGGVSSGFYCSFITEIEQWAMVSGNRGSLRVPDFVLPFTGTEVAFETGNPVFKVQGCNFEMQPNLRRWAVAEHSHGESNAQETNLFRNFADQVFAGDLNPAWPQMALRTQQVMDACRQSSLKNGALVRIRGGSKQ